MSAPTDKPSTEPAAPSDAPNGITRRTALDYALAISAGTIGAIATIPVIRAAVPPAAPTVGASSVVAGRRDEFGENTERVVSLDGEPVLVVATPGGEIRAFGARCSHLGCVVHYSRASESIECPCHGGRYGLDGRVIDGPPPAPLREYPVQIRGHDVVVVRG